MKKIIDSGNDSGSGGGKCDSGGKEMRAGPADTKVGKKHTKTVVLMDTRCDIGPTTNSKKACHNPMGNSSVKIDDHQPNKSSRNKYVVGSAAGN